MRVVTLKVRWQNFFCSWQTSFLPRDKTCSLHDKPLFYPMTKLFYPHDWSMIKETYRWPIKSFVFKSSARPGWRNWWRNFSLIAWYTCVSSVLPFRKFLCILLISKHIIFLVQFGINKHLWIFQRPQIAPALRARAILLVFEKFTRAYLFQIALEIMWLPIKIRRFAKVPKLAIFGNFAKRLIRQKCQK